jgi:chromosome segregation ATPase
MFGFFKNLLGVKSDQAVQSAVEALVRWDPQAATEAELRAMEEQLDELGRQVAHARISLDREQKEADEIAALNHQRMAAAEQLQARLAAETDPATRAGLEKSLETIISMLEQMAPDVAREAKDAEEARLFLEMLEKSYADAGGKLKSARSELERARRDMGRAEQQREAAERQAEAARRAAGLANSTSGLNIALKAMKEAAEKDLATAEAANAKARLLTPTAPEKEDPNIAAAMAAAAGRPATSSLADRLAALKK